MTDSNEDIMSPIPSSTKWPHLTKTDVMPTWAATRSLVLQSSGQQVDRVYSEVVTLLFKSPPTDMTTLYTVLSLMQEISAHVVGTQRQTIIILDMDLYEDELILRSLA